MACKPFRHRVRVWQTDRHTNCCRIHRACMQCVARQKLRTASKLVCLFVVDELQEKSAYFCEQCIRTVSGTVYKLQVNHLPCMWLPRVLSNWQEAQQKTSLAPDLDSGRPYPSVSFNHRPFTLDWRFQAISTHTPTIVDDRAASFTWVNNRSLAGCCGSTPSPASAQVT